MKLEKIIFDSTTNYTNVVTLLNARLSELVQELSSCGCTQTPTNVAVNEAVKYLYVAEIDRINGDTVRYQGAVRAAYNELYKID